MRILRKPDTGEIIKYNRQMGDDALRFSNDVLFLPPMVPWPQSNNVSISSGNFVTSQTTYQIACYFQYIVLAGCLNMYVSIDVGSGGTGYFKFVNDSGTLWESTATSATTKSKSIPSYETNGSLSLQIKTSSGSYPVYVRVHHLSISSRPFYSY